MPELIPQDRENNEKLHARVGNVRVNTCFEKLMIDSFDVFGGREIWVKIFVVFQ